MSFQYYDTLVDKSKENLLNLCEHIEPKLSVNELKYFIEDIKNNQFKPESSPLKSKPYQGYTFIGYDYGTDGDLSKLNLDQLKIIFQTFISKEVNSKIAIKWRFYQNLKYMPDFLMDSIQINTGRSKYKHIDLIVDLHNQGSILICCSEILDSKNYNDIIEDINNFHREINIDIDTVLMAVNKCYRNLPLDEPIKLGKKQVNVELWGQWYEEKCPFNGEDLLIVNNNDLELAGFNFTYTKDLLDYIYEFSEGGQILIFKQRNFFSEGHNFSESLELIWKGIMLKSEEN